MATPKTERPTTSPDGTPLPVPLEPGDTAPEFALPTHDGGTVRLAELRGRRVILFTYPEAMTPGCTGEACDFRDSLEPLRAAGYEVLGVSSDSPARNAEFAAATGLDYPLLSDTDHAVQTAYRAYGMRNKYGNWKVGPIRSTFVIDPEGRLEKVFTNIQAKGHVARLRRELGVG